MKYQIENEQYEVVIVKKNNKNTYIRIKDGKIYVTTSFLSSHHQILALLNENKEVLKKMVEREKIKQKKQELFYYLGNVYDIIIVPLIEKVEIDSSRIYVSSLVALEKWLKKETQRIFQEQLDQNYALFHEKIPYPKLRIRKMTTRWGVCNRKNNTVTLNSELIKYGFDQINYVIVHELSHFVHFDHSKLFWETVGFYFPNYKQIRKTLKEG